MNILISDSWLRDFLETKANPQQIAEYLSLCSQSVEKITKENQDFVYEIEITSNRPDCFSVQGIARELACILPRFGIPAKFKEPPVKETPPVKNGLPLEVKISNYDLCPRFTAIVYDNITVKPSPSWVQKRLIQSGIRALNNVVDISNYLMIELGQPMHTFDYDKILKHKMILREAKEGEEIITLDGQKRKLKEGIIIIEDGEGRIIDLCGIMGGKNSETDENTKRVLLFVQTYNPTKIRKACQALSFRTEAANRFEKGLDPEGVIPAIKRANLLFEEWCEGKVASQLFDIYPHPQKPKNVSVSQKHIEKIMGIKFPLEEAAKILESLGFKTTIETKKESLCAQIPHFRYDDVNIPEDLIEEIARIYGYHNLPNFLPPLAPLDFQSESNFEYESKIKTALKYWGFTETASYSLVSENLISDKNTSLKLANPLTEDLLYLRKSLIPSLLKIAQENPQEEKINIFEIANVYLPKGKTSLPDERMKLGILSSEKNFFQLKGVLELLLYELGIKNYQFSPSQKQQYLAKEATITLNSQEVGYLGEINHSAFPWLTLQKPLFVLEVDLLTLMSFANKEKKYLPLPKYPPIIEDFCFVFPPQTFVGPVLEEIQKISPLIASVKIIDSYANTKTFRLVFQSREKNLEEKELSPIREKILTHLKNKFKITLKTNQ